MALGPECNASGERNLLARYGNAQTGPPQRHRAELVMQNAVCSRANFRNVSPALAGGPDNIPTFKNILFRRTRRVPRVPVSGTRVLGWSFLLETLHNPWVTTTPGEPFSHFGKRP